MGETGQSPEVDDTLCFRIHEPKCPKQKIRPMDCEKLSELTSCTSSVFFDTPDKNSPSYLGDDVKDLIILLI